MDIGPLPEDLARLVEFHGHLCPGLLIGYRAAKAAAARLGLGPAVDEELVAVVENSSCSVDAFQALLSTTFGKGNLIFRDHGKQVFTLIDRRRNRAVRASFVGDHLRALDAAGRVDRLAFAKALLTAPEEEVMRLSEAEVEPPAEAVIEPSVRCQGCGEPVQKSRLLYLAGTPYCRPCLAERSA